MSYDFTIEIRFLNSSFQTLIDLLPQINDGSAYLNPIPESAIPLSFCLLPVHGYFSHI